MNRPRVTRWNGFAIMTPIEVKVPEIRRIAPRTALTLAGLIMLAWAFLLTGAGTDMSVLEMSYPGFEGHQPNGSSMMGMEMADPGVFRMVLMWWGMMLAMMLPSIVGHLPSGDHRVIEPARRIALHLVGYAAAWLVFSLIATALQYGLVSAKLLDPMNLWSRNVTFSATLLLGAGVYQLSRLKRKGLHACDQIVVQSPSLATGLRYGKNCLIATAPLMLLLFAGGVMNLFWIVGLAVTVTVEKFLPNPRRFSNTIGVVFVALAVWLIVSSF